MKNLTYIIATTALTIGVSSAAIITNDGSGNFGATGGVAVEFDATPVPASASTNITVAGLVAGTEYNIDSLTLVANSQATSATSWYLGVYTGFSSMANSSTVSGFQGVSNEAIDWSSVGEGNNIAYTFSGISVTSNADLGDTSDLRYFILQSGTSAITDLPAIANNTTGIQRAANGTDVDSRVAIVQIPNAAGAGVRGDRAPLINVTFSPVPEPSSLGLALLSGLLVFTRRRR